MFEQVTGEKQSGEQQFGGQQSGGQQSGGDLHGPPVGPTLVFVEDLESPEIYDDDRHHLERVLRIRDGDAVTLSDGRGSWRGAKMGSELTDLGPVVTLGRREPAITIAFALIKGERPELITQKVTELGVDRIVPFVADRSVARWNTDRAPRQLARLRRIAREAAMQARRCRLPEIADPVGFDDVIVLAGVCAADRGGEPLNLERPVVMIGPEGGWSDEELERLPARVALGENVLRAETAAITAAGVLTAMRAGLVAEVTPPT